MIIVNTIDRSNAESKEARSLIKASKSSFN